MTDFLEWFFTESDASTIVARVLFVVVITAIFFLFFYYAHKRNMQLYTYVVIGSIVLMFGLSFLVDSDMESKGQFAFFTYFLLGAEFVVGLSLFIQDLSRSIFRMSNKRNIVHNIPTHYGSQDLSDSVDEIVKACLRLSKTDTGALIILTNKMADTILDSGIKINAEITAELLETIFFPKTALHDGAVVISGNKVIAAGCYLPLAQATNLPREFGTRHRAAIGVSTAYPDLTVLVVSEETGIISAMRDGQIKRYLDAEQLQKIVQLAMGLADDGVEVEVWGGEAR